MTERESEESGSAALASERRLMTWLESSSDLVEVMAETVGASLAPVMVMVAVLAVVVVPSSTL